MSSVDVIIVNYNSGALLARAVAALQAQTYTALRVIVVDNDSRDDSLARIAPGPRPVEIVRANTNLGFAGGNNLALRAHTRAPWVALLNPDAFPRPDWLERLMHAAAAHPQFSFFGSRALCAADPARLDGAGDIYHVSGLHWRDGHGCADCAEYGEAREIFTPCAAAALYRTREVIAAGAFDDDFFCYAEDVDLGFRLRLQGRRCLYVPDAVVEHVGSAIAGVRSDFSLYHGHRNLVWVYVKNMPGWLFWAYLPYHALLNLYSIGVFTLRGQGGPLWRAKRDAIKGLRRQLRKRKAIQAHRCVSWRAVLPLMQRGLPDKACRCAGTIPQPAAATCPEHRTSWAQTPLPERSDAPGRRFIA
jgi:GT2 family glycosyltransferase